jgi:RimJ/RimL family protein N-acetyltransferase
MTQGLCIKESTRIRLRQLREDYLARWIAVNSSSEIARRTFDAEFTKPDGAGPDKQYVVEALAGEWLGFTGFGTQRDGDGGGYFYIGEHVRGQGYGEELVRCVLEVMFNDCGAVQCIIDYHDWNTVAARLYQKVGFKELLRIRIPDDKLTDEDRRMAPGKPVDAVVVCIKRDDWIESRKS